MSSTAYLYDGMSLQNKRKSNMDSLLLKERRIDGQNVYLAVVCDGVGSLENGGFAAATAVRLLSDWFDSVDDTRRLGLALRDRIIGVNKEIIDAAAAYGIDTAATLSALLLTEERFCTVHLGDSRIYSAAESGITQLTRDHSRDGKLASCVGRWAEPEIDYNEGVLGEEKFLLCSDGLYKQMDISHLAEQFERLNRRNMKKVMEKLTKYVIDRGESDNITLAVLIKES